MSDDTKKWISLLFGSGILALLAGLDAFRFHAFGPWFDEAMIGTISLTLGLHWLGVTPRP